MHESITPELVQDILVIASESQKYGYSQFPFYEEAPEKWYPEAVLCIMILNNQRIPIMLGNSVTKDSHIFLDHLRTITDGIHLEEEVPEAVITYVTRTQIPLTILKFFTDDTSRLYSILDVPRGGTLASSLRAIVDAVG